VTGAIEESERPLAIAADLRRGDEVDALVGRAIEAKGRIDACVNNAGLAGPVGVAVAELEPGAVTELYEVNVLGVLRVLRAVLPGMQARGSGRIVNIASGAGLAGAEHLAAYSSSKHAVVGLTRSLAREVAAEGISVNAVCPGCVESPMQDGIEAALAARTGAPVSWLPAIPAGRYARPDEIANLVAYLALEAPAYLTGASIVIDGAMRA